MKGVKIKMAYKSQGIEVQHFDTKTGQNLDIQETFKNTVAEYLFRGTTFTLGTVYEGDKTTEEELQRFEDKSLQFANGKKFYFADDDTVRDQLFPTASDGAAYGSLPFTPCQQFTEVENIRVLVIDDETGENNADLDPEYAKTLVGDCYCRIDNNLHQQVQGEENTPFQFRLGIKVQQDSPVARIAKGTVSPMDLSQVGTGYDLILATSAFKGRKTEEDQKIKPGGYNLTVGLGVKSSAYSGTHSLGPQVLVNYPKGIALDIVPRVKKELKKLEKIASDPLAIAQDFIQSTEERYKYRVLDELGISEEDLLADELDSYRVLDQLAMNDESDEENLTSDLDAVMNVVEEQNDDAIYKLLKNDIAHHRQLLDHPKIIDVLNRHLQNRYKELATGRFVKFQGALLQPHYALKEHEFCDPKLPDGAEVIVTRSPLVNSNGVITLTNRHLDDVKHLKGTVYMNAKTAADYLQGDFDGDRVAYELAEKYPNLAAEVKEKHKEENRYKDIEKLLKRPYEGGFESIALSAKDNQIGIIAIKVMKAVALEMEFENLPQEKVEEYINDFSDHMSGLWKKDKETGKDVLPESLKGREQLVNELASLANSNQSNEEKMKIIKSFLHSRVDELAPQLQIAVDGPKSANRPDADVLSANDKLMGYRDVGWLKEYKDLEVYRKKVMLSNSYSPVDLMIAEVNESWEENTLEARQTHQFEKLFNGVQVSKEDIKWAEEVKSQYNQLNSYAFRLKDEYSEAPGPRLNIKTEDGSEVEIIHTLDTTHPQVYSLENAKIYFRKNESSFSHPDLKYVAFAEVPGKKNKQGKPLFKRIGYVSKVSERNNNLIEFEQNKTISKSITGSVTINPGVTPNQVKAAFGQVREFVEKTYGDISDEERQRKAAALWEVTHRRQTKIRNEQGQLDNKQRFNKAVVAFAIFGDEINQQLDTLQFNQVKVAGVNSAYSQTGILPKNSVVPIVIKVEDNQRSPQFGKRAIYVRGKQENGEITHNRLGYLPEDEPQLPIFSIAKATINREGDIEKTAKATLSTGEVITIGELANHDYSTTTFENTTANLEITSAVPKGRNKTVPAVKLDGKLLGVIKDKNSQKILQQHNLTVGKSVITNLNRDYYQSTVTLNIDPQTITYTDFHLTEKKILKEEKPMKTQQKLFWTIEGETAKIAVAYHKQKQFEEAFTKDMKLDYKIISNSEEVGREYDLGLVVFEVNKNALNKWSDEQIHQKWGKPLSSEEYEAKLIEIEEMPEQLPFEVEENSNTNLNSNLQTSSTLSDSPPWLIESESDNSSNESNSKSVQLTEQQQEAFDAMLSSSGIQVPPIPNENLEPADEDEDEYIPSIEELEGDHNTDFDPNDVPLPEDEYDNQVDTNNSQTLDKNNIKPKPKTNYNSSSNNKKTNTQTPSISIPGKPVAMNYDLLLHAEDNKLPVNTTIDAMRGHDRVHTTRPFEPHKIYNFKEGDLAIAYSGNKENPDKQVVFLVGKQYQITDKMIGDPQFRQEWAEKEKHSPQELYSLKKRYHKNNEEKLWGLNMTPLGDYKDGKVYSFDTGEDITEDIINKNYQKILEQQKKSLESQTQTSQTPQENNLDNPLKLNQNNSNTEAKTPTSSQKVKPIIKPKVEEKINEVSETNLSNDHNKQKITETLQPTQLRVYCKGIIEQNNGGWGYSIYEGEKALEENYGGQKNTNEKDMELKAILNSISKAIELNPKAQITIVTSQSVIDQLKQDSNTQNLLWSQINEIANGRLINFNDEQKDNNVQRMSDVKTLAEKGLESVQEKETKSFDKNLNQSNNKLEINTTQKFNVILDLEKNKEIPFTPLNEIPSDPQFDIKRIMEQQQRTEKVAPIALEILKLQNNGNSSTQSYIGETSDINYDGHYLTITDKQGGVKMKARFMGIDPTTQKQKWLSNLPENSPGLTEADVKHWTSDSVREAINYQKINQYQNNLVSA